MDNRPVDLVKEGRTKLFVIKKKKSVKGPSSRDQMPFYNPSMELNRDVSVLVNQWFLDRSKHHVHLLDGLAASGIRGIRLANELTGDFDVTINDWNSESVTLILQNVQKNSLKNISVFQKDLNCLLSERRFHSIDIDPFGSPVYFFDVAVRSVYNHGILACTATDTAALCGVYPQVCYRRYGAWPLHSVSMHEIGLRILLGCLCREAAKYDRGIEPVLSYTTDHYIRLYIQIINGKNAANKSMEQYASIPAKDIPLVIDNTGQVGPLWLGKLQKKPVLQEIRTLLSTSEIHTKHQLWKLFYLLEDEADAHPFSIRLMIYLLYLKFHPQPWNLSLND